MCIFFFKVSAVKVQKELKVQQGISSKVYKCK